MAVTREITRADEERRTARVVGLCILAIGIQFTYGIARPAVESSFLEAHRSDALPIVWLLLAVVMTLVVILYNRVVGKRDLMKLFGDVSLVSAFLYVLLLVLARINCPGVYYALYILKDIYVVLLVEIFYSYTNAVFPMKTARWVFGLFGVSAAASAMTASFAVGSLAHAYGTQAVLWIVPAALLVMALFSFFFARKAGAGTPIEDERTGVREAFRVLRGSSYLTLILVVIAIVQIVITLVDFEFNSVVERVFPEIDSRTAVIGRVYGVINIATFILHALTGPILRAATVPATLLAIPIILATSLGLYIAMPAFAMMAAAKTVSKCFDYTLFRHAKEMLYIPLRYAEKTMGKSIVDMFTYRVAKAGASLLLLGLLAVGAKGATVWVTALFIVGWVVVTVVINRRFRARVPREHEIRSETITKTD